MTKNGAPAKKRNILYILFFVYLVTSLINISHAFAFELDDTEINIRHDSYLNIYYVNGNYENSFYTKDKVHYLYEGEIDFLKQGEFGDEVYGDFSYRFTDDPLYDSERLSIEKFFFGARSPGHDAVIGDYYASFSEYSLNNALRGGKLELISEGQCKFIMLGGIETTQWEDLWEERKDTSGTRKYVWGSRLETYWLDDIFQLNFNYGGARDDRAHVAEGSTPSSVDVVSIDWLAKVTEFLELRGESAMCLYDENTDDSAVESYNDEAFEIGLDLFLEKYELAAEYSRIAPRFNTTGGFSAQDMEEVLLDGTAYLPWDITLVHYLHINRDNIKDSKSTTTKQINPGAQASFQLPWEIYSTVGWDLIERYSTDKIMEELTDMFSCEMSRDFSSFYISARYSKTFLDDEKASEEDRDIDSLSISVEGNLEFSSTEFSWNFTEDIQYENYPNVPGDIDDLSFVHAGGVKAVLPCALTLEGNVSYEDNNYYDDDTDSNTFSYDVSALYEPKKDLVFSVSYTQNDHHYTEKSNEYFEKIITASLNYRF